MSFQALSLRKLHVGQTARLMLNPHGGMLKVCPVFHPPRFLETIHCLGLPIFVLVFPLQSVFTLIEDSNLEKIELSATIHAFFNEL